MKVLLIGPYKNSSLRVGQFLAPPNGIHRIASFVRKKTGAQVDVFDCDLDSVSMLEEKAVFENYDIIGFSILYPTIVNDARLISRLKKLSPSSILAAGGQGAVFCEDFLFSSTPLDVIVQGFGEFPFVEMVESLKKDIPVYEQFKNIKGLFLKKGNGFVKTPPRDPYTFEQFREISMAYDFSAIPYERYWKVMESTYSQEQLEVMKNDGLLYTIRLITSSHCPMKCNFCSSTNFLDSAIGKYQCALMLPVDDIISLIRDAYENHPGVKAIYLNDDNLFFGKERAKKLCSEIERNFSGFDLNFFCLSRLDNVDSELLKTMGRAGFKLVIYGAESFSERLLKEMGKKIHFSSASRSAEKVILETVDAGVVPLLNLILFYPTTRIEDMEETIEKSITLVEKGARINVYSYVEVYPGSSILQSKDLDFEYAHFEIDGKSYKLPWLIMPKNKEVFLLSKRAIEMRAGLIEEIKKKFNYTKDVPHPVHSLALFLAVYKILGKPTHRIDGVIDMLMKEAAKEKIAEKVIA